MKFLSSKTCILNAACSFTWEKAAGWHCREIHWPYDAPELQHTNPSEARR